MSASTVVLATTSVSLVPGQSATFPTFNGTAQTLTLNNLSGGNNCNWSVSGFVVSPPSGTLPPSQQQVFPPTNFGGVALTITNTTSPTGSANLQVSLV